MVMYARAREAIVGTYFLRIDAGTKDRHGNPYVPNMDENGRYTVPSTKDHPRKPGSLCSGKFPHAITQVKMGTRNKGRKPHYVCYASHKIELVVRLFKRTEDGREVAASESELLTKLSDAHKQGSQHLCGDLEDKMMLYLSLHQSDECGVSDVAPLGANAFKARSQGGHLLEPAESLPCTHNGGRPGWYEFEMERGVASINFHTRQRTTSANLKDSLKWDFFTFEVQALNPYLSKLEGFRVNSLPFRLKSVLHNDANSGERYVSKNGFTVIQPDQPPNSTSVAFPTIKSSIRRKPLLPDQGYRRRWISFKTLNQPSASCDLEQLCCSSAIQSGREVGRAEQQARNNKNQTQQ